ncbi:MAG: PH domain-containing protein [Candidatus Harrisonbacteria bacterium]|nr:PH domain-containing protein [Candidatus Harrisonbacteria bacterium]
MIELYEGEEMILSMRKHWFLFTLESIGFIVAALLPILIYSVGLSLDLAFLNFISPADSLFIISAWLLFLWLFFSVALTNYYLDQIIVTNKRLVDIDQISLFSRDVATIPFDKVQDIKVQTFGILATLLKYGDLHIQSAGMSKELVIKGLKNPELVKEKILSVYHRDHQPSGPIVRS